VIYQLKRLGIGTVNLGGNEPIDTHGPDISRTLLPYILRRLTEENIPVGPTTNGVSFTWLDDHYPEELRMINDIDFSLDSPFEAEHDRNHASKLFKLILRSSRRCRRRISSTRASPT
jgi:MoaA/NifB/PqqE/SkfB family radical SAM enzyme